MLKGKSRKSVTDIVINVTLAPVDVNSYSSNIIESNSGPSSPKHSLTPYYPYTPAKPPSPVRKSSLSKDRDIDGQPQLGHHDCKDKKTVASKEEDQYCSKMECIKFTLKMVAILIFVAMLVTALSKEQEFNGTNS